MTLIIGTWNLEWATPKTKAGPRIKEIIRQLDPDIFVVTEGCADLLPATGHVIDGGTEGVGVTVLVGVCVGVIDGVGVMVGVIDGVGVIVGVIDGVGVKVGVEVLVGVFVGVRVFVGVEVLVGV